MRTSSFMLPNEFRKQQRGCDSRRQPEHGRLHVGPVSREMVNDAVVGTMLKEIDGATKCLSSRSCSFGCQIVFVSLPVVLSVVEEDAPRNVLTREIDEGQTKGTFNGPDDLSPARSLARIRSNCWYVRHLSPSPSYPLSDLKQAQFSSIPLR